MEPGNPFRDDFVPPPVTYAAAESDAPFAKSPPLRLSILHLFFFMTCTALVMATNTWWQIDSFPEQLRTRLFFLHFINSFVHGAAISAVAIAIEQRFRPLPAFPREPGHWLFLELGIGILVALLTRFSWVVADELNLAISAFGNILIYVAHATCLVIGARRTERGAWRKLLIYGVIRSLLCYR
jgi:hypothetical protein